MGEQNDEHSAAITATTGEFEIKLVFRRFVCFYCFLLFFWQVKITQLTQPTEGT